MFYRSDDPTSSPKALKEGGWDHIHLFIRKQTIGCKLVKLSSFPGFFDAFRLAILKYVDG